MQIKIVKKLWNNNIVEPKGCANYNITYKYGYKYKTIVHNANFYSKYAELEKEVTRIVG